LAETDSYPAGDAAGTFAASGPGREPWFPFSDYLGGKRTCPVGAAGL